MAYDHQNMQHFSVFVCAALVVSALPIAQITMGAVSMAECPVQPFIPVYLLVFGLTTMVLMLLVALPLVLKLNLAAHLRMAFCCKILFVILALFLVCWFFFGSYAIYSVHPVNYNQNITSITHPQKMNLTFTGLHHEVNPPIENHNHTISNQTTDINNPILNNQSSNQTRPPDGNHKHLIHMDPYLPLPNGTQSQMVRVILYCNRTLYLFAFWTTTLVYGLLGVSLFTLCCLCGSMKIVDCFVKHLHM